MTAWVVAGRARRGAVQLGTQVCIGAWLAIVKAVVVIVERLARCARLTRLAWFAELALLTRWAWLTGFAGRLVTVTIAAALLGVGATRVVTRRALA